MRRPPAGWRPPDPYEDRRSRLPREAIELASVICKRIKDSRYFPPEGSRPSLRDLRYLAMSFGYRVEEVELAAGEPARAREAKTAGSGEWVIMLNRAASFEHKREGILHEIAELIAAEMVPDFAAELFPDAERHRQYIGGDSRGSLAHLAAIAAEPVWRECFGWNEPAEDAWQRYITCLELTAEGWHKEYWRSGRHKGEMERCQIEGVDC